MKRGPTVPPGGPSGVSVNDATPVERGRVHCYGIIACVQVIRGAVAGERWRSVYRSRAIPGVPTSMNRSTLLAAALLVHLFVAGRAANGAVGGPIDP